MVISEKRNKIHRLIDLANENQLEVIYELLNPTTAMYSQEELNTFNERATLLEQNTFHGYSVQDSHDLVKSKFKLKHG